MDTVELTIEKIVYGGSGLARHEGRVVFVPGVAAGEKVRAAVVRDRGNFVEAELIDVIVSSPQRVEPPCAYVKLCGGCQYQHLSYPEELRWKEAQVRELLTRGGGVDDARILPITASPRDYGYRSSVTLHRTVPGGAPQRLGFVGRDRATPIAIDRCLLADERFADVFASKHALRTGEDRRTFRLAADGSGVMSRSEAYYRVPIAGRELAAAAQGFFQNNLPVAERMIAQAAEWLKGSRHVADLYCGVGLFGLLSAPEDAALTFVEESPASVQALRMNLAELPPARPVFEHAARVEKAYDRAVLRAERPVDALVVDPPRSGLTRELCDKIASTRGLRTIVYVSCDPSTLARDLKILTAPGRLRVEKALPLDMFPRTRHVETMALLK